MLDWTTLIAILAIGISILNLIIRGLSSNVSIREHDEFKANVNRTIDEIRLNVRTLEQTRPTAGELEARLDFTNSRGINGK